MTTKCVSVKQGITVKCTDIFIGINLESIRIQTIFHLLLATGRAISNLARNWKYCSSVWWVKPVPTNSICRTDITTESWYH